MCLIKECHNKYTELFEERWLDEIDEANQSEIKSAFLKINGFYETSFILLSKSAISGEYISCESTKQEIEDFIRGLFKGDFITGDSQRSKLNDEFAALNNNLLNSLRHYQLLIDISDTKYDNSKENQFLFSSVKLNVLKAHKLLNFFNQIVIEICRYDYRLPTDKDTLLNLLNLRIQIIDAMNDGGDGESKELYQILLHKCNFIIRKTRKEKFSYSFNSLIESINPSKLDVGGLDILIDKEQHKNLSADLLEELNEDINSKTPKIESFVRIIRHYKENLKTVEERGIMDNVLRIYDEYYHANKEESPTSKKHKYDNFSLDSVRNYIYNCRFSFLSCFDSISFEEILSELVIIQQIQREGVQNFHPYEKGIECLRRRTEAILNKDSVSCNNEDLRLVERKLQQLNGLINKYSEAINWCEFRKFYPFLLPFDESMIKDDRYSIFIPSTFSRAINYQEQFEYLNETKQKLREYHSLFLVKKEQKSIFLLNQENQKRTSELEDTVKKYEKRTYELLGLFTAVITFLFGSVNIFTQNCDSSLPLLITNTMGLGFILLLFAGLILLTTSKFILELSLKDFIKTSRFKFLIVFIIGYIAILVASYYSYPIELNYSTPEKRKESSIQNNIVIPELNKNLNNRDTILFRNNRIITIHKDSIVH